MGPLVVLALAGCEITPPVHDWPVEDVATTGEASGTSAEDGVDGTSEPTAAALETGATGASEGDAGEDDAGALLPDAPVLALELAPVKQFDFHWATVAGAEHYVLLESAAGEPFAPVTEALYGEAVSLTVPLHARLRARYVLRACNLWGCRDSEPVEVAGSLVAAIGYVKASNTANSDLFGHAVALSGDGRTLAVGASGEDGSAAEIGGDQADDSAIDAGAVYVFVRGDDGQWSQQAYVKASNAAAGDQFGAGFAGRSLALSWDGDTLAVGAWAESTHAVGIDGPQGEGETYISGAVYVFERSVFEKWTQAAYVKASNATPLDLFGAAVALSHDGDTLAIAAPYAGGDDSETDGDESHYGPGAVYVLARSMLGTWSQQARLEASNAGWGDELGHGLALSGDGDTLAVGAPREASAATGIDGDEADDSLHDAGAVYVFERGASDHWAQQAYVKASNTDAEDRFGWSVALDADGDTLAVGAPGEASGASRIDGSQDDDSRPGAGAVYVLVRAPSGPWVQQAYVKASNADANDRFGQSVALADDGDVLAVGAHQERSPSPGLGGDQANDSAGTAGAVYVIVRNAEAAWSQRAYVKASNPSVDALGDRFGWSVALSGDGGTLAVGSPHEDGEAIGIGGDASSNLVGSSGAVYLY